MNLWAVVCTQVRSGEIFISQVRLEPVTGHQKKEAESKVLEGTEIDRQTERQEVGDREEETRWNLWERMISQNHTVLGAISNWGFHR